jgi:hypothetical protein
VARGKTVTKEAWSKLQVVIYKCMHESEGLVERRLGKLAGALIDNDKAD